LGGRNGAFVDFRMFWLMGFTEVRHCTPRENGMYASNRSLMRG